MSATIGLGAIAISWSYSCGICHQSASDAVGASTWTALIAAWIWYGRGWFRRRQAREPDLVVAPLGRYDVPAWTLQIREACGRVDKLDPDGAGPVALTVAFEVTTGRNWTALWKPAIDGLGPLLGTLPRPKKDIGDPRDGRITDLGLHQTINWDAAASSDYLTRWAVTISYWWDIGEPPR